MIPFFQTARALLPKGPLATQVDHGFAASILGKHVTFREDWFGWLDLIYRQASDEAGEIVEGGAPALHQYLVQLRLQLQTLQNQERQSSRTQQILINQLQNVLRQPAVFHSLMQQVERGERGVPQRSVLRDLIFMTTGEGVQPLQAARAESSATREPQQPILQARIGQPTVEVQREIRERVRFVPPRDSRYGNKTGVRLTYRSNPSDTASPTQPTESVRQRELRPTPHPSLKAARKESADARRSVGALGNTASSFLENKQRVDAPQPRSKESLSSVEGEKRASDRVDRSSRDQVTQSNGSGNPNGEWTYARGTSQVEEDVEDKKQPPASEQGASKTASAPTNQNQPRGGIASPSGKQIDQAPASAPEVSSTQEKKPPVQRSQSSSLTPPQRRDQISEQHATAGGTTKGKVVGAPNELQAAIVNLLPESGQHASESNLHDPPLPSEQEGTRTPVTDEPQGVDEIKPFSMARSSSQRISPFGIQFQEKNELVTDGFSEENGVRTEETQVTPNTPPRDEPSEGMRASGEIGNTASAFVESIQRVESPQSLSNESMAILGEMKLSSVLPDNLLPDGELPPNWAGDRPAELTYAKEETPSDGGSDEKQPPVPSEHRSSPSANVPAGETLAAKSKGAEETYPSDELKTVAARPFAKEGQPSNLTSTLANIHLLGTDSMLGVNEGEQFPSRPEGLQTVGMNLVRDVSQDAFSQDFEKAIELTYAQTNSMQEDASEKDGASNKIAGGQPSGGSTASPANTSAQTKGPSTHAGSQATSSTTASNESRQTRGPSSLDGIQVNSNASVLNETKQTRGKWPHQGSQATSNASTRNESGQTRGTSPVEGSQATSGMSARNESGQTRGTSLVEGSQATSGMSARIESGQTRGTSNLQENQPTSGTSLLDESRQARGASGFTGDTVTVRTSALDESQQTHETSSLTGTQATSGMSALDESRHTQGTSNLGDSRVTPRTAALDSDPSQGTTLAANQAIQQTLLTEGMQSQDTLWNDGSRRVPAQLATVRSGQVQSTWTSVQNGQFWELITTLAVGQFLPTASHSKALQSRLQFPPFHQGWAQGNPPSVANANWQSLLSEEMPSFGSMGISGSNGSLPRDSRFQIALQVEMQFPFYNRGRETGMGMRIADAYWHTLFGSAPFADAGHAWDSVSTVYRMLFPNLATSTESEGVLTPRPLANLLLRQLSRQPAAILQSLVQRGLASISSPIQAQQVQQVLGLDRNASATLSTLFANRHVSVDEIDSILGALKTQNESSRQESLVKELQTRKVLFDMAIRAPQAFREVTTLFRFLQNNAGLNLRTVLSEGSRHNLHTVLSEGSGLNLRTVLSERSGLNLRTMLSESSGFAPRTVLSKDLGLIFRTLLPESSEANGAGVPGEGWSQSQIRNIIESLSPTSGMRFSERAGIRRLLLGLSPADREEMNRSVLPSLMSSLTERGERNRPSSLGALPVSVRMFGGGLARHVQTQTLLRSLLPMSLNSSRNAPSSAVLHLLYALSSGQPLEQNSATAPFGRTLVQLLKLPASSWSGDSNPLQIHLNPSSILTLLHNQNSLGNGLDQVVTPFEKQQEPLTEALQRAIATPIRRTVAAFWQSLNKLNIGSDLYRKPLSQLSRGPISMIWKLFGTAESTTQLDDHRSWNWKLEVDRKNLMSRPISTRATSALPIQLRLLSTSESSLAPVYTNLARLDSREMTHSLLQRLHIQEREVVQDLVRNRYWSELEEEPSEVTLHHRQESDQVGIDRDVYLDHRQPVSVAAPVRQEPQVTTLTATSTSAEIHAQTEPSAVDLSQVDVDRLVDRVYRELQKKLAFERSIRGI